ncbi:MAG: hypothetical protein QXT73_01235 [Candidatus Methanomethylicaceae archaeon]
MSRYRQLHRSEGGLSWGWHGRTVYTNMYNRALWWDERVLGVVRGWLVSFHVEPSRVKSLTFENPVIRWDGNIITLTSWGVCLITPSAALMFEPTADSIPLGKLINKILARVSDKGVGPLWEVWKDITQVHEYDDLLIFETPTKCYLVFEGCIIPAPKGLRRKDLGNLNEKKLARLKTYASMHKLAEL